MLLRVGEGGFQAGCCDMSYPRAPCFAATQMLLSVQWGRERSGTFAGRAYNECVCSVRRTSGSHSSSRWEGNHAR